MARNSPEHGAAGTIKNHAASTAKAIALKRYISISPVMARASECLGRPGNEPNSDLAGLRRTATRTDTSAWTGCRFSKCRDTLNGFSQNLSPPSAEFLRIILTPCGRVTMSLPETQSMAGWLRGESDALSRGHDDRGQRSPASVANGSPDAADRPGTRRRSEDGPAFIRVWRSSTGSSRDSAPTHPVTIGSRRSW